MHIPWDLLHADIPVLRRASLVAQRFQSTISYANACRRAEAEAAAVARPNAAGVALAHTHRIAIFIPISQLSTYA
jgi:hypothetical protein